MDNATITSIKNGKFLYKRDIVILLIVLIGVVASVVMLAMPKGTAVEIYRAGELIAKYDINVDREIVVEYNNNKNIVIIKDGEVSMFSANCSNQVCVNSGKISNSGGVIACAPHQLTIRVTGGDDYCELIP